MLGGRVGGRRKWTVCRHLWELLKLAFPRKSKLPLAERRLSCHHHVNDSSRSSHASRRVCHRLDAPTYYCNCKNDWKRRPTQPYYKLLLIMVTKYFVSLCGLWEGCLTSAQRRAAPGCFGFTGSKGRCSYHVLWKKSLIYQLLAAVKLRQREKNLVLETVRESGISAITLPCRGTMMWCGHSFHPKAVIVLLAFLKAGFNERKSSPAAPTFVL